MPERHWWCAACDTFDGPKSGDDCDVCADKDEHAYVQYLVPEADVVRLRDGFCDEAYILTVQALDVKALGKGRRRILTEQARRMASVGLEREWPRPNGGSLNSRARLHRLAQNVLERTSGDAPDA